MGGANVPVRAFPSQVHLEVWLRRGGNPDAGHHEPTSRRRSGVRSQLLDAPEARGRRCSRSGDAVAQPARELVVMCERRSAWALGNVLIIGSMTLYTFSP